MPLKSESRSNRERSADMRARLIAAARRLFAEEGYAETSTPEIVEAAAVTRGALYHHFTDKQALFRAVVQAEAEAVADEIEQRTAPTMSALDALRAGARVWLDAMKAPGRTRLLLVVGPAVLGRAEMDALDARHAARTLREGLAAAIAEGNLEPLPLDAMTTILSALFDRVALAVEAGRPARDHLAVLDAILDGLERRRGLVSDECHGDGG